jgi:hypothetical protein
MDRTARPPAAPPEPPEAVRAELHAMIEVMPDHLCTRLRDMIRLLAQGRRLALSAWRPAEREPPPRG